MVTPGETTFTDEDFADMIIGYQDTMRRQYRPIRIQTIDHNWFLGSIGFNRGFLIIQKRKLRFFIAGLEESKEEFVRVVVRLGADPSEFNVRGRIDNYKAVVNFAIRDLEQALRILEQVDTTIDLDIVTQNMRPFTERMLNIERIMSGGLSIFSDESNTNPEQESESESSGDADDEYDPDNGDIG